METINTQLLAPHDVERRLERLRNYSTRWELVAAGPDGQRYLITYLAAKSRNKILDNLQAVADRLIELTGGLFLDWNTTCLLYTSPSPRD